MHTLADGCVTCGHFSGNAGVWGSLEPRAPGALPFCAIRSLYLPNPPDTTCSNRETRTHQPQGPLMARGILWPGSRVPWYWDCEPLARIREGPCPACLRTDSVHLLLKLPHRGGVLWFCENGAYQDWWRRNQLAGGRPHPEAMASEAGFVAYLDASAARALQGSPGARAPSVATTPMGFEVRSSPDPSGPPARDPELAELHFEELYVLELAAYAAAYLPLLARGRIEALRVSNFRRVHAKRRLSLHYQPRLVEVGELLRIREESSFTGL